MSSHLRVRLFFATWKRGKMTVRRLMFSIVALTFLSLIVVSAQDPSGREVPKSSPKKETPTPAKKVTKPATATDPTPTPTPKAKSTPSPTPTPSTQLKNTDSGSTAAKPPPSKSSSASTERARLILTAPVGSDIELDGIHYTVERSGRLTIDDVTTGRHQMSVTALDYEPWKGTVAVTGPVTGFTVPLRTREATGRITVFVNEPGTQLFVDGNPQGIKSITGQPITISGLKQGNYEIRAVRDGFDEWKGNVAVTAGTSKTLNITMRSRLDPEVVLIPSGEFTMGHDKGPKESRPEHPVVVGTFEIAQVEVTNRIYKAFLDETNRQPPLAPGWKDRSLVSGYEEKPVTYVTWEDTQLFIRWLSQKTGKDYRLPTEAEWERAMRSAADRIHYVGRVWEWCADWYDQNQYKKGQKMNPKGPDKGQKMKVQGKEGETRVIRGGVFKFNELNENVFVRDRWVATRGRSDIGFRLVRDVKR